MYLLCLLMSFYLESCCVSKKKRKMGLDCIANVAVDLQSLRKRERLIKIARMRKSHGSDAKRKKRKPMLCYSYKGTVGLKGLFSWHKSP